MSSASSIDTPSKKRDRDQTVNIDNTKLVETPCESIAKRYEASGVDVSQVSLGVSKPEIPSALSGKEDSRKFFDPAPAIALENTFTHRRFV